jgi:hypothetical protein
MEAREGPCFVTFDPERIITGLLDQAGPGTAGESTMRSWGAAVVTQSSHAIPREAADREYESRPRQYMDSSAHNTNTSSFTHNALRWKHQRDATPPRGRRPLRPV